MKVLAIAAAVLIACPGIGAASGSPWLRNTETCTVVISAGAIDSDLVDEVSFIKYGSPVIHNR